MTQHFAPPSTAYGTEARIMDTGSVNPVVPAILNRWSTRRLLGTPIKWTHHYAPSSSAVGILMPLTMGSANRVVPAIPPQIPAPTPTAVGTEAIANLVVPVIQTKVPAPPPTANGVGGAWMVVHSIGPTKIIVTVTVTVNGTEAQIMVTESANVLVAAFLA